MALRPLPDQALLLNILRYEPETGFLYWKPRPLEMFSDGGFGATATCSTWNRTNADKRAAPCLNPKGSKGYQQISIFHQKFRVHRVIWKMVTGEEPEQIDHINGVRTDNRFCNLRAVNCAVNLRNLSLRSDNSSGCVGVCYHKLAGKWWAQISKNGKRQSLGLFECKEDAVRARKAAERRFDFHPNHGRNPLSEKSKSRVGANQ